MIPRTNWNELFIQPGTVDCFNTQLIVAAGLGGGFLLLCLLGIVVCLFQQRKHYKKMRVHKRDYTTTRITEATAPSEVGTADEWRAARRKSRSSLPTYSEAGFKGEVLLYSLQRKRKNRGLNLFLFRRTRNLDWY